MIGEPTLEFLAIRLQKAGRRQFIANWTLKTILLTLGPLATDAIHSSGLRLSHPRVRKLTDQWLVDGTFPAYPPLIVAISKGFEFRPLQISPDTGFGKMGLPLSAIVDVCDGIHRIAALQNLKLPTKILNESEWPVEFIECHDNEDAANLCGLLRGERQPGQKQNSGPD